MITAMCTAPAAGQCGGGVGSDVSDCLLALASGCHSVTGHYQLHGVWSGLRLLFKADLLVALPAVARAWPVRPVDNVPVRPCFGFLSGLEKILKV